jgi:hypothetical protein
LAKALRAWSSSAFAAETARGAFSSRRRIASMKTSAQLERTGAFLRLSSLPPLATAASLGLLSGGAASSARCVGCDSTERCITSCIMTSTREGCADADGAAAAGAAAGVGGAARGLRRLGGFASTTEVGDGSADPGSASDVGDASGGGGGGDGSGGASTIGGGTGVTDGVAAAGIGAGSIGVAATTVGGAGETACAGAEQSASGGASGGGRLGATEGAGSRASSGVSATTNASACWRRRRSTRSEKLTAAAAAATASVLDDITRAPKAPLDDHA